MFFEISVAKLLSITLISKFMKKFFGTNPQICEEVFGTNPQILDEIFGTNPQILINIVGSHFY